MKFPFLLLCVISSMLFADCGCREANVEVIQEDQVVEGAGGYHLILDCTECEISKITDLVYISGFFKNFVGDMGLGSYTPPSSALLSTKDAITQGYSLAHMAESIAISGHFVDESGDAYIDIFSSRYFNPDLAIKIVQNGLSPQQIKMRFLVRP